MTLFLIFLVIFFILLFISTVMSLIDLLIFYFVSKYKECLRGYRKVNVFPIMMISNFQAIFMFIPFSLTVFFLGLLFMVFFSSFSMSGFSVNLSLNPLDHLTSFSSLLMWSVFVLWPFSYALRLKINNILWHLRDEGKLIDGTSRYIYLLSFVSMFLFLALLIFVDDLFYLTNHIFSFMSLFFFR